MHHDIRSSLRPALVMAALFTILLGLAYPLALTGLGQALFPRQANGSLVRDGDRVIGSTVVGQAFVSDRYFRTRPSAAGAGYDGMASSGSNLGPASRALADRVRTQVRALAADRPGKPVPGDLVTTSASGLDPDISPEAAYYQVDRVARQRGLDPAVVRSLVARNVQQPFPAFLGERFVNVLALNRQLDGLAARHPS